MGSGFSLLHIIIVILQTNKQTKDLLTQRGHSLRQVECQRRPRRYELLWADDKSVRSHRQMLAAETASDGTPREATLLGSLGDTRVRGAQAGWLLPTGSAIPHLVVFLHREVDPERGLARLRPTSASSVRGPAPECSPAAQTDLMPTTSDTGPVGSTSQQGRTERPPREAPCSAAGSAKYLSSKS